MAKTRKIRSLEEDVGDLLASHDRAEAGRDLTGYAEDPVGFVREVTGGDPWELQEAVARAVRDAPLVTVRSCHAAGKDWLAARLALWWVYARRGLVILTGPTATQVEEILMRREVRAAFQGSELPGELHVRALRPDGEGEAGVLAKTATGVSALTGFHEARVLFVITEAQDPDIDHAWDAAFACTTGESDRILTLGNPTEQAGRFYRAHRSSEWRSFRIGASSVPNVREGRTVVPGLLTREGVERFAREYGEESGFYVSRVLAEFPEESEEGLFRREWLDAAAAGERWSELERDPEEVPPVVAVDPARFGPDATVAAIRRGSTVERLAVREGRTSTGEVVGWVEGLCRGELGMRPRPDPELARRWQHNRESAKPEDALPARGRLVVDEVGLGGGTLDRLRERRWRAEGFNGGRQAHDTDRFFNARAESYWTLRKLLEGGEIALPDDEPLFEELLAMRWRPTPQGKVQLERKEDVKSRLGRSPDRADAVAMAFAGRATEEQTVAPVWGGRATA